jgi:hypothetical protein
MLTGTNTVVRGTALAITALGAVVGLALPASALPSDGYPQVHRFRPTITLTECQRAGGIVQAGKGASEVCTGGIDNGDPVVGE